MKTYDISTKITTKDVHLSKENWKTLMQIKMDLNYKTINDIVSDMILLFQKKEKN
jgi:hypothetical protein